MKLFTHVAFLMLFAVPLFASAQTTPLQILEKPKPELPKDYSQLDVQDSFLFKVDFLQSGKIGKGRCDLRAKKRNCPVLG